MQMLQQQQQPVRFAVQLTASIPHEAGADRVDLEDLLHDIETRFINVGADVSISFARSTKGAAEDGPTDEEEAEVFGIVPGYR